MVKASSSFWGSNLKERLPKAAQMHFLRVILEGFVKVSTLKITQFTRCKRGF